MDQLALPEWLRAVIYIPLAIGCFVVVWQLSLEIVRVNGGSPSLTKTLWAKMWIFGIGGLGFLCALFRLGAWGDVMSILQLPGLAAFVYHSHQSRLEIRQVQSDVKRLAELKGKAHE